MLEQLTIRNFALFSEAVLAFGPGLHVLTGETGAGKSLVVDAVNFLCGAKTDRDFIRAGSDKAYVEGLFEISDQAALQQELAQLEIETEGEALILSREMSQKGRSIYRVNGLAVALGIYQQLTAHLIDIHGQHEHQSLLGESRHLHFLDLLGDKDHEQLLADTRAAFLSFQEVKKAYQQALQASQDKAERMDLLLLRKQELENARLVPGEEEALQAEKLLLRNADKLGQAFAQVNQALFDAPREETAGSLLQQALQQLDRVQEFYPQGQQMADRLRSLQYELEEFGHDLATIQRDIHQDDARLEEVEARLDLLRKLQRKYGPSVEAMLHLLDQVRAELLTLEGLETSLEQLAIQAEKEEGSYIKQAQKLSQSRMALAQASTRRIEASLQELNMASTRFLIKVERDPALQQAEGQDRVQLLIAPNVGEEMKPLARIASGGELSRVMLAMKTLAAEKNEIPTMVFDEIDTGVSGHTAQVIARRLWDIGRYRQVICVSHLHQLAAMASSQYLVSKAEAQGRTQTDIRLLKDQERIQEIAKMLGDLSTQGKSSLEHARVLLADSQAYRDAHPGAEASRLT